MPQEVGDGMYGFDTMNEEVAIIIEQYADHAQARLPGIEPKWQAPTPDSAVKQLMDWLHNQPAVTAPVAVSLLQVPRNTFDLRPPTVAYAPEGVVALFSGNLDPVEPPPPEAIWLKPDEHVPDDVPDGSVFVIPRGTPPFHTDGVVIRSHSGGHRLLHFTGGGGVLLSPFGHTVVRIHQRRETTITPSLEVTHPKRSDNRIAVIIEQGRDHAEAYLPGMGPAWHTTDVTPDQALEYLLQLIHRHQPTIPSSTAPVAVSLVTVHPDTANLHPATVERAPSGVMVLFLGRLLPSEEVPMDAHHLRPGDPIPDDAPRGRQFLVPPLTEGLDDEGNCPSNAVILRSQPGQGHRLLHHAGPVVLKYPERLVRIEHGPWGEPRHAECRVK